MNSVYKETCVRIQTESVLWFASRWRRFIMLARCAGFLSRAVRCVQTGSVCLLLAAFHHGTLSSFRRFGWTARMDGHSWPWRFIMTTRQDLDGQERGFNDRNGLCEMTLYPGLPQNKILTVGLRGLRHTNHNCCRLQLHSQHARKHLPLSLR